ncbi:exodeoxyribonuclease VII small subunit [Humibacillus sp. DSM 29435]|uniref:exodeoxyribonuclease VII small subunit n=1 Tax=Humibacillus sp. DSM 29435 TaxID=1869167 RepID=UPI0009F6A835|nr:exodeoxyribonuclease VII small subunit [Humibacillus sp. DSM 29435]
MPKSQVEAQVEPQAGSPAEAADPTDGGGAFPDIAGLRYEDAREELVSIVAQLEAGQAPLEDSMHLWRRGEALAAHCATWLDGAQAEIEAATATEPDGPASRP